MFSRSYVNSTFFIGALLGSLAMTLIGTIPVSVFAQTDTEAAVVSELSTTDTNEEMVQVVATTTVAAVPVTTTAARTDTYKREKLPNDDVFNDFVVGPGKFELELSPGESKTVELIVSNRMGQRELFELGFEDADGSDDPNSAISLLGERVGPYTIKDFISVPYKEFYLDHAERVRIPVTITLPKDAEPGGRYGSILTSITTNPGDDGSSGGTRSASAIVSRIGTLFFVTTPGDIDREGQLSSFTTLNSQHFFLEGPVDFALTYENTGSVHLNPYGKLTITNILNENVGEVELVPWFVMPKSIRSKDVSWNREFLLGRYVATVEINRGYDNIVDTQSFVFWVFPWKVALAFFAGLFVFFLIIRFFTSRFEFKRK